MRRQFPWMALTAILLVVGTSTKAQAWGRFHAGYTHIGPGGIYHAGRTVGVGPYGAYSGARIGGVGAFGGYAVGGYNYGIGGVATPYYGYNPYYSYTPTYSGGYAVGGYHYITPYSVYPAGVYRAW